MGVQATPTFFINGKKLEGLAPFSTFQELIEQAAGQGQ
ncbi:MAG: DsbA family protein [Dehalococcoidia bacterium]